MTNKSTKRALVSSLLVLVLCFTMLLGTTFAWFTDSASSNGNKITTGNLDVDLYLWTGTDTVTEITSSAAPIFDETTIWEPGMTKVVYLSIVNNGSLALKYKVGLEVKNVTKKLNEVMSYDIIPDATFGTVTAWSGNGTNVDLGTNATEANNVELAPGAEHYFALAVHMDENAGNEYMNGTIEFDINVLAGQLTAEEDSFGKDYDKDAVYPNVSTSYVIPTTGATEDADFETADVKVSLPASIINNLPQGVEAVQLAHTDVKADADAKTITFDAVEFVDQNGNIIDLTNNTEDFTITLPVGNVFAVGTTVKIFHDGAQIAESIVDADGNITYEAAHFCEISITEKVNITVTFSDGYTRNFNSLKSAMRFGYSGGEAVAITVYEDITEEMDCLEGNIVCGKEGGVTIKNTIVDEWIYCDSSNFTIGEGVTYDASGYASGLFVYGDNCVINGDVITDCYYQRYEDTKLTINAPGSLTVKTETFILRYTDEDGEAGIYVNGDNDDSTVELKLAVAYFYQGMISAKDATLVVGTYWQTNETDNQGSANLVLDNSTLTVTVNEHDFKATGNSTVTLKNGSVLDVAGGIVVTNEISVDETSVVKKAR